MSEIKETKEVKVEEKVTKYVEGETYKENKCNYGEILIVENSSKSVAGSLF